MRVVITAILISVAMTARADGLCNLDYSKLDSLHVKETDLTREKYDEALKTLQTIDSKSYAEYNEIHFGIIFYNALKMIEGYALKSKAQNEAGTANYGKAVFCSWLEKAHWSD